MWTCSSSDGERLDRRGQGQEERRQPAQEARELAAVPASAGRGDAGRASRAGRRRPAAGATATSQGSNGQERRKASSVGFIAASLAHGWADRGRTGRRLARRAQADQELDQGGHLGRLHLLAVGRHVAAARRAVADLIDELVARQADADRRSGRDRDGRRCLPGRGSCGSSCSGARRPLAVATACSLAPGPPGSGRRSRPSSPATRARWRPRYVSTPSTVKITMTDSTATGRRLGARSPRLLTNGTSSRATIRIDREDQDDERLRRGRAERQQGEQPQERPVGPRIRARAASGRAGRSGPWGRATAASDHDDDHGQGREEGVLQHGVAEEGDARASAPPRIPRRRSRDRPACPGTGGALIPRFSTSQRCNRQEGQQRAGDDEDVQGEEPAQRVAADHRPAQQQVDDLRARRPARGRPSSRRRPAPQ